MRIMSGQKANIHTSSVQLNYTKQVYKEGVHIRYTNEVYKADV